jgi:hypothetical protein
MRRGSLLNAFEVADAKADNAADELGRLLHRLTAGLDERVAPTYAMERMMNTFGLRQPQLFVWFHLAMAQRSNLSGAEESTTCDCYRACGQETLH